MVAPRLDEALPPWVDAAVGRARRADDAHARAAMNVAYETHEDGGTKDAIVERETRSEVEHLEGVGGSFAKPASRENRARFEIPTLGTPSLTDRFDRPCAADLGIEKRREHGRGVEAGKTSPHDASPAVDQCAELTVADNG